MCVNSCDGEIVFDINTAAPSPLVYEIFDDVTGASLGISNDGVLSNLCAGCYEVEIYNPNWSNNTLSECITEYDFCIEESDPVINGIITIDSECDEEFSASIDITVSGGVNPYDYIWSTGANTPIISNLIEGVYTCLLYTSPSPRD